MKTLIASLVLMVGCAASGEHEIIKVVGRLESIACTRLPDAESILPIDGILPFLARGDTVGAMNNIIDVADDYSCESIIEAVCETADAMVGMKDDVYAERLYLFALANSVANSYSFGKNGSVSYVSGDMCRDEALSELTRFAVDRNDGKSAIEYSIRRVIENPLDPDAWQQFSDNEARFNTVIFDEYLLRRKLCALAERRMLQTPAHLAAVRWCGRN